MSNEDLLASLQVLVGASSAMTSGHLSIPIVSDLYTRYQDWRHAVTHVIMH